jgi:hypothetical protein
MQGLPLLAAAHGICDKAIVLLMLIEQSNGI